MNDSTCSLMYSMNASLPHLPILWMINVATPDRIIVIAPPDLMGCNPLSSFVNSSISFPIISTIPHNFALAYVRMWSLCLVPPHFLRMHRLPYNYSILVPVPLYTYPLYRICPHFHRAEYAIVCFEHMYSLIPLVILLKFECNHY